MGGSFGDEVSKKKQSVTPVPVEKSVAVNFHMSQASTNKTYGYSLSDQGDDLCSLVWKQEYIG